MNIFQKSIGENVKDELGLSNYATKVDLKNATDANTSKFAEVVDLASLKSEFDKLEIPTVLNSLKSKADKSHVDKLVAVHVDLSKLSDVIKNDIVKKTEYDDLVKES